MSLGPVHGAQHSPSTAPAALSPLPCARCVRLQSHTSRSGAGRSSHTHIAERSSVLTRRLTRAASAMAAAAVSEQQTAQIIDGKAISAEIKAELKQKVEQLKAQYGKAPGLAVVLVGNRGDSETYVRSKKKACEEVGIVSFGRDLPEDVSQEELLKVVEDFNADPDVHGILVQLPLPKHIQEKAVLDAISLEKDVDGFHPFNIGSLAMRGREPLFVSCTPKGCLELLDRAGVEISGKRAVVVGRSNIVGTPVAMLLTNRDATVTVLHSRSQNAAKICATADIVIAAVGKPEVVKADWVKPGAAVIDVGTNAVPDSSKKRGYRLVGDVDFAAVSQKAAKITPVPGGVGPMTIVMLLSNTVDSAARAFAAQQQ